MAKLNQANKIEIYRQHCEGVGTQELATKYRVSTRTIQRCIVTGKVADNQVDDVDTVNDNFTALENAQLKDYFGNKISEADICYKYKIPMEQFSALLHRCPLAQLQHLTGLQRARIRNSFTSGIYISDLADHHKTTDEVINKIVKR